MSITHVTSKSFEQEVLKEEKTVLLDFWAPWCMPCKRLGIVLEQIASDESGVKICKVNIDEEPELVLKNNVMSIPTLQVIKQGDIVKKSIGYLSKKEVLSLLELEHKE